MKSSWIGLMATGKWQDVRLCVVAVHREGLDATHLIDTPFLLVMIPIAC